MISHRVSRIIGLVSIAALALLFFSLYAAQARFWSILKVFDQYNVLFDADPIHYLGAYAHGWGRATLVHAGTSGVGVVNRFVVLLAESLNLISDPTSARIGLAVLVAPLCGAGAVTLIYAMAIVLGCSRAAALAIAAAFGSMFASGVFFSIPESYPLAAPILLSAFLLVAVEARRQCDASLGLWLVLAIGAALVTITNVAAICLAFVASRWARRGLNWPLVLQAALIGAVSLSVVAMTVAVFNASLGYQSTAVSEFGDANAWAEKYVYRQKIGSRLLGLASLPTQLTGIPDVVAAVNHLGVQKASKYTILVTYEPEGGGNALWGYAAAGVAVYLFLLAGFGAASSRPLALAGFLVLVFNFILHLVFGAELFLYGIHFSTAIIALWVAAQRALPWPAPVLGLFALTILFFCDKRISDINHILGI